MVVRTLVKLVLSEGRGLDDTMKDGVQRVTRVGTSKRPKALEARAKKPSEHCWKEQLGTLVENKVDSMDDRIDDIVRLIAQER